MRRTQGRNTYYTVFCLKDGTVTSALTEGQAVKPVATEPVPDKLAVVK